MKTVAQMTEAEQIERLVRQRNELYRLLFELVGVLGFEPAPEGCDEYSDTANVSIVDGKMMISLEDSLAGKIYEVHEKGLKVFAAAERCLENIYMVEGVSIYGDDINHELIEDSAAPSTVFVPYIKANGRAPK